MANTNIKGSQLMLFVGGKSIAYATSHTLTLSTDSNNVKTKDHGMYGFNEVTALNWEITSENLYTEADMSTLFDAWNKSTELTVAFGKAANWTEKGLPDGSTNWTPDAAVYTGKAVISNLSVNAAAGENATLSITLQGRGALKGAE